MSGIRRPLKIRNYYYRSDEERVYSTQVEALHYAGVYTEEEGNNLLQLLYSENKADINMAHLILDAREPLRKEFEL